jgi:hypothetical protein
MFFLELMFFKMFFVLNSWAVEGGGGGGAEAPKPESAGSSVSADEWIELSNRVMNMRAKVGMKKETLRKLVEEKQTEKNPARLAEIIKQMVEEHKGLQKEIFDYNQQSAILKFRFPEKAMANDRRKYERMESRSLEQIETQLSLDAKIKKAVAKTRRQFSPNEVVVLPRKGPTHSSKDQPIDTRSLDYLKEPVVVEK